MTNWKQKIFLYLTAGLGLAVFLVVLGNSACAETVSEGSNLAPGSVQLDDNFAENLMNYAKSITDPGPFTGEKEADMEAVPPFIYSPFAQFNLLLDKNQKQSFQKGENIDLKGVINYKLQNKDEFKNSIKKGCEAANIAEDKCIIPNIYNPSFSDLGIFVQVWRKDDSKNPINGDYLLDEFYTSWGVQLSEGQTKEFDLKWKVPEETVSGDYYFSLYVNSDKRFSLLGVPFQAFSSSLNYGFNVLGQGERGVELDKNNILINDQLFVYSRPAPELIPVEGKIIVQIPLTNLNESKQSVKFSYELSDWSQENPTDIYDSNSETKELSAGEKSTYRVVVKPDNLKSVQNLRIIAQTNQNKSIANIRFLVKESNQGVFRYLGLASQENGGNLVPMFCLRNAQSKGYFDGKVRLTISAQGNQQGIWEKQGKMLANQDRCFVITDAKFNIEKDSPTTIKGEIFDQNGRVVDEKEISFSPQISEKRGLIANGEAQINKIWGTKKFLIGAIVLIVIAILGILKYFKQAQAKNE